MRISFSDDWQPNFGVPYPFKNHPASTEELQEKSDDWLRFWVQTQYQVEEKALEDPVTWGWRLPSWEAVMDRWRDYHTFVILGGNRASKSELCARLCLSMAESIPEARIRCWSVNDESSKNDQQKMIWGAMPQRYKSLREDRGKLDYSLQYSQKNGFSGRKVVLPPVHVEGEENIKGGEIIFQTYKGYANDPQIAEGWWSHLVWADEELPQPLFETLLYRLKDARGRLVLSFTTLKGWTPLIGDILGKTRTLKRRFSALADRELPVMQESLSRPGTLILYFWTEDNPFIPTDSFLEDLKSRPKEEVLARAHGIPTKAAGSKFPLFDDGVHVIPHESLPWLRKPPAGLLKAPEYKVTRYMGLDPAGRKNWFMLWLAIDAAQTVWVYREWPDISLGEWALPGHPTRGKAGPAQESVGYGVGEYVELVNELEENEVVFERIIDPRMGAALKSSSDHGMTSIIHQLEESGMSFIEAPIFGIQNEIEHGIQLINDRLFYDTSKKVDGANSPSLYVSDQCENLIWSLKNYTGDGGSTEASKDPIDVLRYLLESDLKFVTDTTFEVTGTWGGY